MLDERDFLDGAYTRIRDDFNNLDVEYRHFRTQFLDFTEFVSGINDATIDQKILSLKTNFR